MDNNILNLIIPTVPLEEPRSADFFVRVNGEKVECQLARVSAMPFNRVWSGKERPLDQTEQSSFVVFEMGQPVEVEVVVQRSFSQAVLRPISKEIAFTVEGNTIRFTISKPGQFSLELDGRNKNLTIFANPIKTYEPGSDTLYFGPGVHDIEKVELHSGQTLFVDSGAVVYARTIRAFDSENIRIIGHGILDFSRYERTVFDPFTEEDSGSISFTRCTNILVDGVILRDAAWWAVTAINCFNVWYENVKLIGMWRYNADGLDFVNSQNVRITNCFVRSFDDGIVLKGVNKCRDGEIIERHDHMSVENYLIENCVVWCDWGGALEIGAETVAKEYRNIVFRNCDVIHVDQAAMRIHCGGCAEIHHIFYENICAEYSAFDTNSIIQATDDQVYVAGDKPYVGGVIRGFNYCGPWMPESAELHTIHDIFYKNIRMFSDAGLEKPDILFHGADKEHGIYDITIEDLYYNGEKLTAETAKLDLNANVRNLIIR